MTESGSASASQLMAAGESRELVGAVRSFVPPKCAEASGPHERASANRRLSSTSRSAGTIECLRTASAMGT